LEIAQDELTDIKPKLRVHRDEASFFKIM